MAAIDDLTKAINDVTTALGNVATEVAAVAAVLKNPSTTDAQIEAAATQLEGLAKTAQDQADALSNALVPPATT
jgi:ABC-type transporter Mla subunit MlaD